MRMFDSFTCLSRLFLLETDSHTVGFANHLAYLVPIRFLSLASCISCELYVRRVRLEFFDRDEF